MKKRRKICNIVKKIKTKKAVPYLLLLFVVSLSIAYSAFGTELNIGKFISDVRLERDIRITGVTPFTPCKYTTDSQGNEMVKCGSESFYVMEKTESEVTMLSAYNLTVSETNPLQDPTDTGVTSKNTIAFSSTAYWKYDGYIPPENSGTDYVYDGNSNIYKYVEAYRNVLEDMGVKVIDAKLMSYEQVTALGCANYSCNSAPSWVYSSRYWLGYFLNNDYDDYIHCISTDAAFVASFHKTADANGIRPVITIPTSSFEILSNTATNNYLEYNVNSISAGINLPNEDSSITYNVEITNIEALEMGILDITGLPDNLEYELDNYELKDKICDYNGKCNLGITKEMQLTIKYKEGAYNSNDTSFDIKLDFNFQPFYKVKYTRMSDYNVGDVITSGSESFYVIDSDEETVTALAKYNLTLSETNPLQDTTESRNIIAFSSADYWSNGGYAPAGDSEYPYVYDSNSNIYQYVEVYRDILEGMGANITEARLMSYEEALALGCSGADTSCESAPSWVYSSSYWFGSALEDMLWRIYEEGSFDADHFSDSGSFGIRPVITFSKKALDLPTEIMAGGTLEADLEEFIQDDEIIKVKIDGVEINDYTYENGLLGIPNVNGHIEVTKYKTCKLTLDVTGNNQIDNGDEVTCGTETFYVIPNDSTAHPAATGNNVTLLAKYNLDVGGIWDGTNVNPISNPTGIQTPKALGYVGSGVPYYGIVPFSATNYWGSVPEKTFVYNNQSSLYPHVENYKTYMKNKIWIDVKEASIPTFAQYDSFKSYPNFNYTTFWLGSSYEAENKRIYMVYSFGNFDKAHYGVFSVGVRPIIVMSANEIRIKNGEAATLYTGQIYRNSTDKLTIGDNIDKIAYETDLSYISQNYYLKHEVVDNIVTASYACIKHTEDGVRKETCLEGGNSSYYSSNQETLRSIESYFNTLDYTSSSYNNYKGYCSFNDSNSVCRSDSLNLSADSVGYVESTDGSFSCHVHSSGISYCLE